jgi:hypothetical protein
MQNDACVGNCFRNRSGMHYLSDCAAKFAICQNANMWIVFWAVYLTTYDVQAARRVHTSSGKVWPSAAEAVKDIKDGSKL